MMNRSWLAFVLLSAAACSTRSQAPEQPQAVSRPDPAATWNGDSLLAPLLRAPVLGRAQIASSDTLASLVPDFDDRLAAIAVDTAAPPLIRSNAVLLLSDRRVPALQTYLDVLDARDDRVRASGIVALRPFLQRWPSTVDVVRKALRDSSAVVQTKALELLSDGYVDDLRAFTRNTRHADLRTIADDLIRTAEERGAPLPAGDSTGTLSRTTAAGHRIIYRPRARWKNWDASLGSVQVVLPDQRTLSLGDSVEVVANVVPAFISAEGEYAVYETNRSIRVRDLRSGSEHAVASGVAPRLLPFAAGFVFLRQIAVTPNREVSQVRYEVVQAGFAGGEHVVLGMLTVKAQQDVHGNYAPVRWMRVRERDGTFSLTGDTMEPFRLPDPFGATK